MKIFFKYLFRLIFGPIFSSVIIAFSWQWYHFDKQPQGRFYLSIIILAVLVLLLYTAFKKIFKYFIVRFKKHPFWIEEFFYFLDNIFFVASLYFLIFFSKNEIHSLLYFSVISIILFVLCDRYLGKHPEDSWQKVWRILFSLSAFIFLIQSFFQYFAFKNYILDPNIRFFNIVLFRSIAISIFWLAGFAASGLIYIYLKKKTRFAFLTLWSVFFIFSLLLGLVNVGILYHSNLYFSPIILAHTGGGGLQVFWLSLFILSSVFLILSTIALFVIRAFFNTHKKTPHHIWFYFDLAIIFLFIIILFGVSSLRNTPEAIIIKSFYEHWRGLDQKIELNPVVKQKLEKFGIFSDPDIFYINSRENVFTTSTILLPDKFKENKPNIVIFFLESFSSRLSSVYNQDFINLTPGLEEMANDNQTTIFKNYFNASTPTITGLVSQLCSFLPPTGHEEIHNTKQLQKLNLSCLPEILLKNGYRSTGYITAVNKDFAHKDSIFNSMGVKNIWGTKELSKLIEGEPLSWGYSDHQMFPVFFEQMKIEQEKGNEPFLLTISTIDSHPPFRATKDIVPYEDGENILLNSIHTTDDAFKDFWHSFKNDELYNNTVVIAVADHAVFPSAYGNFPDLADKMNFYDEVVFLMYIPENILPKEIDTHSSFIDFTPTLLHILDINEKNIFEGHSIFDNREQYPNLLGMHEFGLWINQEVNSERKIDFSPPALINCKEEELGEDPEGPLTLCEFKNYFQWKRLMFEQGRLWLSPN